jgi:hypothetical protein
MMPVAMTVPFFVSHQQVANCHDHRQQHNKRDFQRGGYFLFEIYPFTVHFYSSFDVMML